MAFIVSRILQKALKAGKAPDMRVEASSRRVMRQKQAVAACAHLRKPKPENAANTCCVESSGLDPADSARSSRLSVFDCSTCIHCNIHVLLFFFNLWLKPFASSCLT